VEFLGRADNQVKILGHRVEPGEVEAVLGAHEGVRQVCVIADADGNNLKHLVAYYVPRVPGAALAQDLRAFLRGKVPQYMIPAQFIALDALPLSPNGKVDRFALPAPEAAVETNPSAETPVTDMEETIADLWRRILRAPRVGLEDNFFDLGGDSLLLVAIHSNLQKILKIKIEVTELFEFTTVRSLARRLEGDGNREKSLPEVSVQAEKQRAAFAAQRRLHKGDAL
jgi:non-ribosomal peptide synthetase component F